jgi:hypothetical protein
VKWNVRGQVERMAVDSFENLIKSKKTPANQKNVGCVLDSKPFLPNQPMDNPLIQV